MPERTPSRRAAAASDSGGFAGEAGLLKGTYPSNPKDSWLVV